MKILALAMCVACLFAAETCAAETAKEVFDRQLTNTEREFVSLVEAMPANNINFAPTQGEFKGVRTFAAQAKHAAAVIDMVSAALLGEKTAADENGPAQATSKDQIVQYVKAAFAHGHRAMATLTDQNLMGQVTDPFNPNGKRARVEAANEIFWHTFDHYGQMVEYARMNGIVPPASKK